MDGIQLLENRGRNLFDPVALLGVYGLYFFYVAPLLHVGLDYWFINARFAPTDRPEDWRTWLGWMGMINLLGLAIYRACHKHFAKAGMNPRRRTVYQFQMAALRFYAFPMLALALVLQVYIYARFGGIGGFVDTYARSNRGVEVGFTGLGWLFCVAESFPVLLVVFLVAVYRTGLRNISMLKLIVMLGMLTIITLLFGGLRGSRSNTVIALLYAVGIVHVMVRRLSWRFFAIGGAGFVVFMYLYGFYKVSPQAFATALTSSDARAVIEQRSGRSLETVLLGDLERADTQAYLLYRMTQSGANEIQYAWGETYVDGMLSLVPRAILSYRPPGKLKYGTDAFFGQGAYSPGRFSSSKVYGLAGETMLNFGPYGVPLAFFAFGMVVGLLRGFSRRIEPSDSRQYVLPILSLLCVLALSSDLDNIMFAFLEHALLPGILIWFASSKRAYAVRSVLVRNLQEGIVSTTPMSG
jgi:hypothetical protein